MISTYHRVFYVFSGLETKRIGSSGFQMCDCNLDENTGPSQTSSPWRFDSNYCSPGAFVRLLYSSIVRPKVILILFILFLLLEDKCAIIALEVLEVNDNVSR